MTYRKEHRKEYVPVYPLGLGNDIKTHTINTLRAHRLRVFDPKTEFQDCFYQNIKLLEPGKIFPSNPMIYQEVEYDAFSLRTRVGNLIRARIINVTEDGIFASDQLREFFIHRSQISKENVVFDGEERSYVFRSDGKIAVRTGSIVLGRVVSISHDSVKNMDSFSLTLRQEGLSVLRI